MTGRPAGSGGGRGGGGRDRTGTRLRLLAATLVVALPALGLLGWTVSREVEAQQTLRAARALDAAEAAVRATLAAFSEEVEGRIESADTATAVILDAAGRPLEPALRAGSGPADQVSPELRAAIESGRDLEQRFGDPSSAIAHFARLVEATGAPGEQVRLLQELGGTHASQGDWRAAAAVLGRALAIEEAAGTGLLGARRFTAVALVRIDALARLGRREEARLAARRLAGTLELMAGARGDGIAPFGLRLLEETLGEAPLEAAHARVLRDVGRALARPEALDAALARAAELAQGSTDGFSVLGVPRDVGPAAPRTLLGVRATMRVPVISGRGGYVIADAGLDQALLALLETLASRGVLARLRDPGGAPPAGASSATNANNDTYAARQTRERIVPLGGALAGWSAEVRLSLPADEVEAAARESRLLLAALGAAGIATVVAALFVARGAARAIDLERTRADFVAGVTHDLKTPLALVRMYAETIRLGRVEGRAETERFLDVIIGESDRLHGLIENVLAFQRRGEALTLHASDLGATVRETAAAFVPASDGAVRVEVSIEEGLPAVAHDRGAVERIVRNLLANAARFAPPGSAVRVRAAREAGGVRIEVADEGPGIPAAIAGRVFEPFVTGGSPGGGTGLGLSIVRALAIAHGGSARVRANAPTGTVAEVWLPGLQVGRRAE